MTFRKTNLLILFVFTTGVGFLIYDKFFKEQFTMYSIIFEEPLNGLLNGSQVFVGGILDGYVDSMKVMHENLNQSIVKIKIKNVIDPSFCRAQITSKGFTGNKTISISHSQEESRLENIEGLPQIKSVKSFMYSASSFLENIEKNEKLKLITNSAAEIVLLLESSLKEMQHILVKINESSDTIEPLRKKTVQIFDDASDILKTIKEIVHDFKSNQKIKSLLNNDIEVISDSISDFSLCIEEIKNTISDFNKNPLKFIYGK